MEDRSSDHLVLGGLLFLVFSLVVALVFVYTRAGDTGTGESPVTTAEIENQAPAVDSVNIAYLDNATHVTPLALTLGGQRQVVVWGSISDANGEGDIDEVSVVLRRSGAVNADSCTEDMNDCYKANTTDTVPECTISDRSGTTAHYACTMNLEFFADGTLPDGGQYPAENWVANVVVTDLTPTTGTGSATTEVSALLGLNIPTAIAYGQFALGATSSVSGSVSGNGSNVILDIDQKGNVIADVTVQGAVMTCSALGTISIGNQKWATTTAGYSASTALTGSGVDTDLAVAYQTNDSYVASPSRKNLYWYIGIPSTGVRGTCSGTNTISIVAAQ